MQGHSLESEAAAAQIGLETPRSHLRRLFTKTDTTRQAELIRLLSKLG